jgi:hypothetical protein
LPRRVACAAVLAATVLCAAAARPAGAAAALPRILTAGDSEMQGIYVDLQRRFGTTSGRPRRASVIYDAHPSTGISNHLIDWVGHAFGMTKAHRQDATLMYLGGNEFGPIDGARCCGAAWTAAYARRARKMMVAYRRGGAAKVYWALLPVARKAAANRVYRAVDSAILAAAAGFPKSVRVIDLRAVFTPGGRYRSAMRYQGRVRVVREADGIHLSRAGDHIATQLFVTAMRRDGIRLPG